MFKTVWNALMHGEHSYGHDSLEGILIEDAGKFVWLIIAFGVAIGYMCYEEMRVSRTERRREAKFQQWLQTRQDAGKA